MRAHTCMCDICTCFLFLGSALYLIRLPAMNLEEFANSAAQTGILTHQETIDLFLHFTASNKPSLCFATKPRQGLKTQVSKNHIRKAINVKPHPFVILLLRRQDFV